MASEVVTLLQKCPLFSSLPVDAVHQLDVLCETFGLRGGERLLRAGEPSTHLYIVAVGRLRAIQTDGTVLGDIGRFEPIGEMGILTGEPHRNDVEAIRDSLLLRIDRVALLDFVTQYPAALLAMTQVLLHRLRGAAQPSAASRKPGHQTLAVIGAEASIDIGRWVAALETSFKAIGKPLDVIDTAVVDTALGAGSARIPFAAGVHNYRLTEWLAAREQGERSILYCAGDGQSPWTERCLRQSDRILVFADSTRPTMDSDLLRLLRGLQLRVPIHLVLLRSTGAAAGDSRGWRSLSGASAHHYVAPGSSRDFAALARQLGGAALGLVLGGGGARGFAHIGLIRALESMQLPIDLTGGTSMGALFAGLAACGADSREMRRVAFESFVQHNHLNDYVLPRVALIRGRKFLGQLRSVFGNARIEDLRLPYFCISTNLTRGIAVVHDSGELATWVGTSMAVPGVVPPVVWNGELLVDGAIVNSLPTDVMQALGRGPILASDVSTEGSLNVAGISGPDPEALLNRAAQPPRPGLIDILFRSATLTSESGVKARAARADLYLRMPVSGVGLFDWKRLDEIVERGYRHAMESLENAGSLLDTLRSQT
jgi:predicted acylesterase/phospholipase RssA/CRP-like cAMP-binding protein